MRFVCSPRRQAKLLGFEALHTLSGCVHVHSGLMTFVACANLSWHRWRVFS